MMTEQERLPDLFKQVGFTPGNGGQEAILPQLMKRYWRTVVVWRWLLLAIVASGILLGIVTTLMTSPEYTATVQIQIDRQRKQITNMEGIEARGPAIDLEFYSTQYSLLKTRELAKRVAIDAHLVDDAAFLAAHGIEPKADAGDPVPQSPAQARDSKLFRVENLLLAHVKVRPVMASKLVDVVYTSRDPQVSARIANAWAAAFIDQSMDREYASTADARAFLEKRIELLREKVQESEKNVVLFGSQSGIVNLDQTRDGQGRTVASRTLTGATLDQMSTALNIATADRIAAQARSGASGDVTAEATASQLISTLRGQRSDLAAKLAAATVESGPDYPAVVEMNQQLRSIDASLARETARIAAVRNREYGDALKREETLRAQVADYTKRLDQQNRSAIQYGIYQREADTNRQLYDALLQRYKEIGVAGVVAINNIAIVDPAIVPRAPSSPKLFMNVGIALLLSLGIVIIAIIALDQIDEAISEPSKVEPLLGFPLLGITPAIDPKEFEHAFENPRSDLSEALFSIHSSLAFATPNGLPRSIALISTCPGEGKSSTAHALARIIARREKRVLLVDADMRSPSVHKLEGVENGAGLSNLLVGAEQLAQVVQHSILPTLDVVTAGPNPPSPAELLSSDRLGEIIREALGEYDHVIVDCPPVMGMTDAPLIARVVEGIVYVVESAAVDVRGVRAAIKRVTQIDGHVLGIVLAKVQSARFGYGHIYGYGYGEK